MLPPPSPLPQAAPPTAPPHSLVQALTQRATVPALMTAAQRPTPPSPLELVAALHALAAPAPPTAVAQEHPQVGAIRSALLHAFLRGELVRGKGQQA